MFVDGDLIDLLKTNMILACEHGISVSEVEAMVPFERQVMIMLILDYMEMKKRSVEG